VFKFGKAMMTHLSMDERRRIHHRAIMSKGPIFIKALTLTFSVKHPSQTSVLQENKDFNKRNNTIKRVGKMSKG